MAEGTTSMPIANDFWIWGSALYFPSTPPLTARLWLLSSVLSVFTSKLLLEWNTGTSISRPSNALFSVTIVLDDMADGRLLYFGIPASLRFEPIATSKSQRLSPLRHLSSYGGSNNRSEFCIRTTASLLHWHHESISLMALISCQLGLVPTVLAFALATMKPFPEDMTGIECMAVIYGLSVFIIGSNWTSHYDMAGMWFSLLLQGAARTLDGSPMNTFDVLGCWKRFQIFAPVCPCHFSINSGFDYGCRKRSLHRWTRDERAVHERPCFFLLSFESPCNWG